MNWFDINASLRFWLAIPLVAAAAAGSSTEPRPLLASRLVQPKIEIDLLGGECSRHSQCLPPSPCLRGICSAKWCNWWSASHAEISGNDIECFLGRELIELKVPAECGAQVLEGNVASNGAVNDFNLRYCPSDDLESCRQQRVAGLRRQLRQDAETLVRCIAADPALSERYIATRLPWDQTHPRGAYIDDTPPVASMEGVEAPAETTEAQPTSGESESDAPSQRNNIGRGSDLRDESILEHTHDTQ